MTEAKRNHEWRSIPEVPDIEVNRDGELRVLNFNGHKRYNLGTVVDIHGNRMTIQMMISKAFPDIPMRVTPTW